MYTYIHIYIYTFILLHNSGVHIQYIQSIHSNMEKVWTVYFENIFKIYCLHVRTKSPVCKNIEASSNSETRPTVLLVQVVASQVKLQVHSGPNVLCCVVWCGVVLCIIVDILVVHAHARTHAQIHAQIHACAMEMTFRCHGLRSKGRTGERRKGGRTETREDIMAVALFCTHRA